MKTKYFFLGVLSLWLFTAEKGYPSMNTLKNLKISEFQKKGNSVKPMKKLRSAEEEESSLPLNEGIMLLPSDDTMGPPMIPEIVPLPVPEDTLLDSGGERWVLEKTYNIDLEGRVNVVVPLEIISDLDIKALVIDDQKLEIPFEIEMNKTPEKLNYYALNYSETEIDIDGDGTVDTLIHSPKYINGKIVDDNLLVIDGKNITREGIHRRKVYITVELMDGGER